MLAASLVNRAEAQSINVSVNVNLHKQPAWGPVGYDYAAFYYFPDLNIYFDVNNGLFYYPYRGNWAHSRYLPDKYHKHDLYVMYKVVLNEYRPWANNRMHKRHYSAYKKNRNQIVIRNSYDRRYEASRRNHHVWVQPDRHRDNDRIHNNNRREPDRYNNRQQAERRKDNIRADNNSSRRKSDKNKDNKQPNKNESRRR